VKKLTLTITIAAVLTAVFLALAFPVSAQEQEEVTFTLDMCYSPEGWAFGTFTAEGAVTGSGVTYDEFEKPSGTMRGVKWLGVGTDDMIIMKFNARVIPVSHKEEQWIGHFVIDSGTGAYEGLNGQGTIDLRLREKRCKYEGAVFPFSLDGTYSGVVQ